jgi:hypothetical protein
VPTIRTNGPRARTRSCGCLVSQPLRGELGVRVGLDDVKPFREGSVGWAAGHGYFELQGRRVPVRLTAVVHQKGWRLEAVRGHASIGVPNEPMLDPMFQGTG